MDSDARSSWFAVRCVFASGRPSDAATPVYEERITMWLATSEEDAIERAESEALDYANAIEEWPATYLGLAQSYRLFDVPGDGAEVFSLLRNSELGPEDYLNTFFDTGAERQTSTE